MNNAILYIAISLDGFVAGVNDDISWLFRYNDVDYGFDAFFCGIGAIIQGRRAYEVEIKNGWETPSPVPTFVLSHHLPECKPQRGNLVFTDEDISEVLKKAKQQTSKDVWIEGGANVAQQFLDRDLIDEIVLSIVPVILGDGIRLFGKTHKSIEFVLREVRQFDKDLVQLTYTRK
jgi:dihydrofolate reductase